MKDTILTLFNKYRNFILYGLIGSFCAALDFLIYTLLCKLGMNYLVANIIGIHCGIFSSFLLNRHFNFKVKDNTLYRFLSFYAIGLIGLALSSLMLYLMVDKANQNEIFAKLITVIVVAVIQFFMNKFITFRKSKK